MHETLEKYNKIVNKINELTEYFDKADKNKKIADEVYVKVCQLVNQELPQATQAVQYYLNRQLSELEAVKGFEVENKQGELML